MKIRLGSFAVKQILLVLFFGCGWFGGVAQNVVIAPPPDQTVCEWAYSEDVVFDQIPDVTYSWTNDRTSIGLAASGTGDIRGFQCRNTGITPVIATITVTPFTSGTPGLPFTFKIIVNPRPNGVTYEGTAPPFNGVYTSNANIPPVNYRVSTGIPGTEVRWTNDNPAIGLPASGVGNIPSFAATNNGLVPVTARISAVEYSPTCMGSGGRSFSITVNPTIIMDPIPDVVSCALVAIPGIVFNSNISGTTFRWTNDNTSIGLGASGTGNIAGFNARNTGTTPSTATITVTPTANGESGDAVVFTITVKPTPDVLPLVRQSICYDGTFNETVFKSNVPGTTFTWTNDNPNIGLPLSGIGDIPAFSPPVDLSGANRTIQSNITVTPELNGCKGTPYTAILFYVTPNIKVGGTGHHQTVTNNESTGKIQFFARINSITDVPVRWVNDHPEIGLAESGDEPGSGTQGIQPFKAVNLGKTPIVATLTINAYWGSCVSRPQTITITVLPTPDVIKPDDIIACNNEAVSGIIFNGNIPGTTYRWTNNNTSIGLGASGTGNIARFTAKNTGTIPKTATITVIPTANGVDGDPVIFTITVKKAISAVSPAPIEVCGNTIVPDIRIVSNVPSGASFSWTGDATIGLTAGTGEFIPSFKTLNNDFFHKATIIITPMADGCTGDPVSLDITVNGAPDISMPSTGQILNAGASSSRFFPDAPPTAQVRWTNDNPNIGLAESGVNGINSFIATNTGSTPQIATITFIASGIAGGCDGIPQTYTITVNPTPDVIPPTNQTVCNEGMTTEVKFTSNITGTTFRWTNNTPNIGLGENGNGDIASFKAKNTTTVPIIATITVIPTASGADGTPVDFTITVNPTADVIKPADQTLAHNETTTEIKFTSNVTGTTYQWINSNPAIGLAASGNGDLPVFTAVNTGIALEHATIAVTPTANGCTGTPVSFTITVVPKPVDRPDLDQVVCGRSFTTAIVFDQVPGTTYNWINNNAGIGLARSGTGNIPSFQASDNRLLVPIVATITVTPVTNGIPFRSFVFTFTVNPTPGGVTSTAPYELTYTNNESTQIIDYTPTRPELPGVIVTWHNSNPDIGLPANGTGDIPSFITINTGTVPVRATIFATVKNDYCDRGTGLTKYITVNPTADVIQPVPVIACNNETVTDIIFRSNVTGTTFTWTNDTPGIGLAESGTDKIASFTVINSGIAPVIATITVIPTAYGTEGPPVTFTITINPTADVIQPIDKILAHNETSIVSFSSNVAGTTYSWTNNNPGIGLGSNGTGDINFTAVNAGIAPIAATITVTPTANGCTGVSQSFTITVNPIADVIPIENITISNQETVADINFNSNVAGTTFAWKNDNSSIGLPENGNGNITSFVAVNTGKTPIVAIIKVTPKANGADGVPVDFSITVNPTADVIPPSDESFCDGNTTSEIIFSSNVAGTTFTWTNDNPGIGLAANGTGNIPSFLAIATGLNRVMATITVTPRANGLNGTPVKFTISVLPLMIITPPRPFTVGNNCTLPDIHFDSNASGNLYVWSSDNPGIGLPDSWSNAPFIPAFKAVNIGTSPITATVTVYPIGTGGDFCNAGPFTFTITVNPDIVLTKPADQTVFHTGTVAVTTFSSNIPGTTYSWINDNTSIGLAAQGIGDIASFSAVNTGAVPVTATITVTPTANGCSGTSVNFTITVNPIADVTPPTNQTVCNDGMTTEVKFTGNVTGTTFRWTNNNTSIGLAATGNGDIAAFKASNAGTAPVIAMITVTPTANGADGTPVDFTITVNPTADVIKPADQTLAHNTATTEIKFSSNVSGTTYSWTNDNTSIGLSATGNGDLAVFTAINTGTAPVTATITVTPTANGCTGISQSFTTTVNPVADVIAPADLVVCNEEITTEVKFSSNVTGTTFSWTNNTPGIGLAASGYGDIAAFKAINIGHTPVLATIRVTPKANGADGVPVDFRITVKPTADVIKPKDQVVAHNVATTEIKFSSNVSGTTYSWTNDNTSIGLSAAGNGDVAVFTAINTGTAPVTATITVTPTANGCTGVSQSFTITVNQIADVITPSDLMVCNEEITTEVKFSSNVSGTTYSWTNNNTSIGLAASGNGDVAAFKAVNARTAPVVATITVTPIANGADGTPVDFTITVNPTADVIIPADQTVAHNATTTEIKFSGNVSGTTYSWTNDNIGIGLAAAGNDNIAGFRANNTGRVPVTATITVTPTANGCTGVSQSFTITVDPIANVIPIENITISNQETVADINFNSNVAGTTFAWKNDNSSIGLPETGNGNIASFVAVNTGKTPIVAIIKVTPKANGADGVPVDFSITVNPTADVIPPSDESFCDGNTTSEIIFSSNVAGTTFTWTNDNPGIGLAANGTGNIPSFLAIATGLNRVMATITVTPRANGLNGTPVKFTISVLPLMIITPPKPFIVGNNCTLPDIHFDSNASGNLYVWSSDNPGIGLPDSWSNAPFIPAFKAVNIGTSPITATVTVYPIGTGGDFCNAGPFTFTITVNPDIVLTKPADQTVFHTGTVAVTTFSSNIPGTTYSWINDNTSIGLAAQGIGDIGSFSAINTGTAPVTATITVTPTANGCTGVSRIFTITVNQIADVIAPSDLVVCNEEITTEIKFSSNVSGTTYSWTNNTPGIGLAVSGYGDIAAFKAINIGYTPVLATIRVTPRANGADGAPVDFRIIVNPTADVIKAQDQTVAHNAATTEIKFNSNVSGTTYSWTNDNTSIGLSAAGNGDVAGFTAINTGTAPVTATITVTPAANGCTGVSQSFTITVNQVADVIAPADLVVCNEEITTEIKFSSNVTGTTFRWANNNTSIGLAATGNGNIAGFKATNSGAAPLIATIRVTPSANGADGVPVDFRITVNPTADVIKAQDQTVAHNAATTEIKFNSNVSGTTYSWTNDNISIGLSATGNGDIAAFKAVNEGIVPVTATITVTPTANGCTGVSQSFTITVNPIPDVIQPVDLMVCNEEITTEVKFNSNVSGTTYSWTNDNISIGLAATGNGNIAGFKATNSGAAPLIATIRVTPSANGADGVPVDFRITVNPTADVIKPKDQVVAHNVTTTELKFSSNVAGTTYSWTNDNTSIGLSATGNGDIAGFTANNTGNAPVTATITVTPTANGCTGVSQSFTITVNQIADVIAPSDLVVCNEEIITEVKFNSNVTGTTFRWANNNTSIGLAATGNGNIAGFKATNSGTAPLIATIRVTPSANGADGVPVDFRITVNPTADVIKPKDQVVAHNTATTEIKFSSNVSGTTYSWTNDNTSIGLSAAGNGDVAGFTAINTGTAPVTATITVTPTANGCTGVSQSFTITVNQIADVIAPADLVVCNEEITTEIKFSSNVSGTTYSWTNNIPDIGLTASGHGDIVAFTAINTSHTPVVATIRVTPMANGADGVPVDFRITVNPTADVVQPKDQTVAHNEIIAEMKFSSNVAGTTYSWTNDNTSIGLSANGTGHIAAFRAANVSPVPVTSTITVVPTANGCPGNPVTFTITVNPIPDMILPSDLTVCNEEVITDILFRSNIIGTTYSWTNDNTNIGLAANGSGNINSFKAINTGVTPLTGTITVTPTANGLAGNPVSFFIVVNPTADIILPADQIVCNNEHVSDVVFRSIVAGTTYSWTNNNPAIGLGAAGVGNINAFSAINAGTSPIAATITVIPTANGCAGMPISFTITVNPTADVIKPSDQTVCNNTTIAAINFQSSVAGTTYTWINDNPAIGLSSGGIGNINSFTAVNTGTSPITARISVIPGSNGCPGVPVIFTITVAPQLEVITKDLNICGPNGNINLINGLVNYDPDLYSYIFYDTEGKELTSSQLIIITKTGDYKVKSKDKINGCQSALATISVGRIALPVVKINHPAATYAPFTIDLTKAEVTAGSDPGLSFHYFLDAAGTEPLLNPEKVGGEAGNYTYYLTGQNAVTGCLSIPVAVRVEILPAPTVSISSAEINEGEEVTLTLQLSNNAVLPENITINLQGSVIKVPYQIPAQVQLKAGENMVTFTVTTQKSNLILKDQQVLIITGQQSYYQVNEGDVKINDVLTDDKSNPVVLSISDGRIYEQGDVLLTVSLPGNLITDHDLEISLLNGMGTTLGSTDYSYPAKVTIPAGQHDLQFKLTAGNKTGSIQKVVVDGKASALGFDFSVSSGTVTIDGQRLIIGKVISDNGDGVNDYFAIENITEYPDNEVVVFNRWGQEVYRAKGYNNDTIRFDSRGNVGSGSGRKVPDGTYFYLISINKEGKRTQFKSFIKIKTQ